MSLYKHTYVIHLYMYVRACLMCVCMCWEEEGEKSEIKKNESKAFSASFFPLYTPSLYASSHYLYLHLSLFLLLTPVLFIDAACAAPLGCCRYSITTPKWIYEAWVGRYPINKLGAREKFFGCYGDHPPKSLRQRLPSSVHRVGYKSWNLINSF